MAIDDEVIQDFISTAGQHHLTSDPPNHLECSICRNLLQDPVVCDNGSHTFCRNCLVDWISRSERPLCPIDRQELCTDAQGPKRAPHALQDCIDALEAVCALGCGWKGPKGTWPDHLRHQCPEVEDDGDDHAQRDTRPGTVPSAIRRAVDEARAAAEAEAIIDRDLQDVAEAVEEVIDDLDTAILILNNKTANIFCDVCDADIHKEAYMCMTCPDFDLCSECWHMGERNKHARTHAFVKVRLKEHDHPVAEARANASKGSNSASTSSSSSYVIRNHGNIHWNITCDGCNVDNMVGIRYNCTTCADFDLCQNCVDDPNLLHETHTSDHEMLRVNERIVSSMQHDGEWNWYSNVTAIQ